jgi:hypothetical protein
MSTTQTRKQILKEYMQELGRKGGSAKTRKKTAAAKKNIVKARKAYQKLFPKNED